MKKHLSKRILALLLTLVMVLSLLPMTFAEEPAAEEFTLATTLSAGDKVVIYHPASGKAMSTTLRNTYYREGVDVTVADGTITDPDAALIWTVEEAEGGFKLLDAEGHKLSMQGTYNSIPNDQAHDVWALREGAAENTVNITNVLAPAGSQGDPKAIEYYNNQFTGYYLGSGDAFVLQLYVLQDGEPVDPPAEDLTGKTVILHTNDTHGALLGFAQVAKVKADYEAKGAEVLLVDAGDYSQGTNYVSASKGETAVIVMNAAGYDIATLGNHDFDFGYEKLAENMSKAEFLPLCANVIKDGESLFTSHVIKEADGVKIGFFGLETPETATKVNPGLIQGINFLGGPEMYSCAQGEIDALREEGADIVIGVTHLGVDLESGYLGNRSTDLYAHVTGVDFLIDGHSHTVMTEGPNGEPIQSTGTKASEKALANVGLIVIDNETKKIERNELIPLGEEAPMDETVAAVAQGIMDAVDAQYGSVFATSEVELNGDKAPGNRTQETNNGDLITDAMLWSVLRAGSIDVPDENVVAITNGGGIRAPIHVGDVTMNDIHTVLPFGNTVAVVYVSGEELLEALEASTFCTPTAIGGFPQVAGMKYSVNTDREFVPGELYIKADGNPTTYYAPDHIRRVTINEIGGKPFDPKATYAVVTNNFCAAGGDTYNVFMKASNQFDTNIPMDEAVMDYIVEVLGGVIPASQYAEPQGRIQIGPFRFTDVTKPSKYYYTPVYWAYNHDPQIVAGTGDGTTFSPNKACTRAEIVTFLYAAAGRPEISTTENPFTDVKKKDWFYQAAVWAKEAGITGGTGDGKFQPNKVCTRAEVVTFLYAWAGRPEIETVENPFTDVKKKDYFYTPVLWAVENGVTGGTGDGTTFEPKKACTRGEIVTFLYAAMRSEFEFLVTSDLHGQIYATDYTVPYEQSGTYKRGLTRIATYIKEQKAKFGSNVYTVDMGDTFQGAPLTYYYAFNKPEEKDPAILAFRTIGYDMWVVGNHEFNYGLEILNRQMAYAVSESTDTEQQLQICLANYLDAANNSDESKDWSTWKGYEPYVIKKFGSYKVAVIGFGNPNVPKWDVPANWEGIYFADIIETYQHYEAEMLEKADMIVVVAHSGIGSDEGSDFMERLVNATNTIAFAFSGHEHGNQVYMAKNADGKDVPILQPYTKARAIAQVNVVVDNGEVTVAPQIVNMENYPVDEELAELLKPYETETWENYMLQPIGKALGDYPAANLGTAPSAFMDLINTVQIWGAYDRTGENTPDKAEDDKPAMLSISAPLTSGSKENLIPAGDIYLGDMFGLYRFENWFYQITMSGEEVHQWLEFAATKVQVDEAGNPFVTNGDLTYYDVIMGEGFHYDIDAARPEGERVVNMTYNGEKVAADDEFTVVVNNYRYNGGGNYVKWLNEHGCAFVANDPDRIIYSTQFDMIQGEDEGQARALLVSYIKEQSAENGGITPFIISDWTVQNGIEELQEPAIVKVTEAPADWTKGTYYLVYEVKDADGNVTGGKLFNGNDETNGGGYVSVSIEDGVIPFDAHLFCVNFETMEGGYAIHTGNGYMGNVSSGNGVTASNDTPVLNTVSFSEEGILLISNNRYFRFNTTSGQDRFRYFNQNATNDNYPLPALYVLVNAD